MLASPDDKQNTSDSETAEKNAAIHSLSPLPISSRQSSIQSLNSITEEKPNEVKLEQVEVNETCSSGNITSKVYFSYISAGGNAFNVTILIFVCLICQFVCTGGDYWISYW